MAVNTAQAGSTVRTFLCAADLSEKQGYIVSYLNPTDNTVELTTDADGIKMMAGVVVDGGTGANTPVSVCIAGVCRVFMVEAAEPGDGVRPQGAAKGSANNAADAAKIGRLLETSAANSLSLMHVQFIPQATVIGA